MTLDRITIDPNIMGGRACVRGMRIPVSIVLKMLAGRMSPEQILADYPDLEADDIDQCIQYAAMLADDNGICSVPFQKVGCPPFRVQPSTELAI
jgi:uncharacterized protein (DUF433 family)